MEAQEIKPGKHYLVGRGRYSGNEVVVLTLSQRGDIAYCRRKVLFPEKDLRGYVSIDFGYVSIDVSLIEKELPCAQSVTESEGL